MAVTVQLKRGAVGTSDTAQLDTGKSLDVTNEGALIVRDAGKNIIAIFASGQWVTARNT